MKRAAAREHHLGAVRSDFRAPNPGYAAGLARASPDAEIAPRTSSGVPFFTQDAVQNLEVPGNVAVSKPSPHTHNSVGHLERQPEAIRVSGLGMSSKRSDVNEAHLAAKALPEKLRTHDLLLPIAYLATCVHSQKRLDAAPHDAIFLEG